MVIFHSYVKLPEGIYLWIIGEYCIIFLYQWLLVNIAWYSLLFIGLTVYTLYITLIPVLLWLKKQASKCCCFVVVRPVKQVISRSVTFSFVGMSAPSGTSPEGPGIPVFSDAAMANPGVLPISDTTFSVDISTPTGSDKSRSLRDRRHLPPFE